MLGPDYANIVNPNLLMENYGNLYVINKKEFSQLVEFSDITIMKITSEIDTICQTNFMPKKKSYMTGVINENDTKEEKKLKREEKKLEKAAKKLEADVAKKILKQSKLAETLGTTSEKKNSKKKGALLEKLKEAVESIQKSKQSLETLQKNLVEMKLSLANGSGNGK